MKYVIDFYDHIDELVIDQYLVDNNITKIKQLESFGKVYLVESENEIIITDLVENLSADADQPVNLLSFTIDLVDNYTETTFDIEDEKNWWKVATINKIDFDEPTHTHKIRGMNSTVYIIDSGITIDHPEFATANIELLHTFNGNFADNNGHGTGLSSLIVGPTCGLANPRLKVVKLFDNTQPTLQSDMLIALDAVLNDFVTNGKKASVVNMSWSIPRNDYINAKIQYMINQGMYIVAAAGNSGVALGDVTPASIPDVLTIGSFNQNLEPSSFSNYTGGSDISYTANDVNYGALDGWAPGELIWAANKNGGYGYIAGTSAAAAITSAAFAYNVTAFVMDAGQIRDNVKFVFSNYRLLILKTLGRGDILDLTDPKYSNSVNQTVSVFDDHDDPLLFKNFLLQVTAGSPTTHFLFNPTQVTSVSYDNVLPSYITIDTKGFATFNYSEITEPLINLPGIELTVTNKNGTVSTYLITLSILMQGYDTADEIIEQYPEYFENNIELQYSLKDDACCSTSIIGPPYSCIDTNECSNAGYSCGTSSKPVDPACKCSGGFIC